MNKINIIILVFLLIAKLSFSDNYKLSSPNKRIEVQIVNENNLEISISLNGVSILYPTPVSMKLQQMELGADKVLDSSRRRVEGEIIPVVKIKEAKIKEAYNELTLNFENNYSFIVRVYNEGVAYRFKTSFENDITVISESAKLNFPKESTCWWGREKSFISHNQVYFDYASLRELKNGDLASLPLIINTGKGSKIVLTETDLIDYPGMWVNGVSGQSSLTITSAKYPKEIEPISDRILPIVSREDYIAKTKGTRSFPWRVFAISTNDAGLVKNQLTYLLSQSCKIEDPSWIKPGKIAWDWWNANNVYGVDFESGFNTETYKYYIDFASKYNIEYIIVDEGWYVLGDVLDLKQELNMDELIRYGNEKGVGIILWVVWKTLDEKLEVALDQFEEWGVKGIKVDFMNRDDQEMVNYYEKIARETAKRKLLVDFHGSYKPAGLRRMYPNVMTREGVNGGEQYKWSYRQTPEHDLILPFGRMLAGPLDYTPGAMNNAQEENFRAIFNRPMSMGTRCHQLAMYVIYESPLQMLCDHPSNYYKEPEAMEFLSPVPVDWDQTEVLKAKVSDYLIMARRNGDRWYLGGMTDWSQREFEINFLFLPKGKKYKMILLKDGINANKWAPDFKREEMTVDKNTQLSLVMAKGGGFAAQLVPIN